MAQFSRITQNPAVMSGKPCIRGMRVMVGMIRPDWRRQND
jgi:uncharacterized protein (DUF433 family)